MYADFRSQAALDARQAELRAIARKYPVSTATGVGAELRRKFLTEVRTLEKWAHRRVYTATWPFFLQCVLCSSFRGPPHEKQLPFVC